MRNASGEDEGRQLPEEYSSSAVRDGAGEAGSSAGRGRQGALPPLQGPAAS